jgi:hypothetical protein
MCAPIQDFGENHSQFWVLQNPDFRNKALKSFARTHKEERRKKKRKRKRKNMSVPLELAIMSEILKPYSWSANPNLNLLLSIHLSWFPSPTLEPSHFKAQLISFSSLAPTWGRGCNPHNHCKAQLISLPSLAPTWGREDAILTSTSILWFQNLNNPEL